MVNNGMPTSASSPGSSIPSSSVYAMAPVSGKAHHDFSCKAGTLNCASVTGNANPTSSLSCASHSPLRVSGKNTHNPWCRDLLLILYGIAAQNVSQFTPKNAVGQSAGYELENRKCPI
ncbi:sIgD [Platysternon megacephalum]|uniref:SIgD n=1 Tax=Platysternon megacephalum TaxID=55544 RepID=A0A4D9DVK2_9SAUR|nr:sIgD [Platysternon megacephalum]